MCPLRLASLWLCLVSAYTFLIWSRVLQHVVRTTKTAARKNTPENKSSRSGPAPQDFSPFSFPSERTVDEEVVAIFYNIYLPTSADLQGQETTLPDVESDNSVPILNASTIFSRQMAQLARYQERWRNSNNEQRGQRLQVYYNTIGDAKQQNLLQLECKSQQLECHHMHHYAAAQEDVTLQSLYDYCRHKKSNRRVAYLHAKGSFHQTVYNNKNRVTVTFSVLNKCLDALGTQTWGNGSAATTATCDVCGGLFLPVWGPFFSANMWAAECGYIQRLIPPLLFGRRMKDLYDARHEKVPQLQTHLLQRTGPYCWGTDRYSNEHWVASHPSLRPCDARGVRLQQPAAPRNHITDRKTWRLLDMTRVRYLLQQWPFRRTEVLFLPGLLFKSAFLYQQLPPAQSWMWSWFADGDWWRQQAQKHGLHVVEKVLSSPPQQLQPFDQPYRQQEAMQAK